MYSEVNDCSVNNNFIVSSIVLCISRSAYMHAGMCIATDDDLVETFGLLVQLRE